MLGADPCLQGIPLGNNTLTVVTILIIAQCEPCCTTVHLLSLVSFKCHKRHAYCMAKTFYKHTIYSEATVTHILVVTYQSLVRETVYKSQDSCCGIDFNPTTTSA